MADNIAASNRFLAASSSGEAINEGTMYLLLAVVLGVVAEIGGYIARQTELKEYQFEESETEVVS